MTMPQKVTSSRPQEGAQGFRLGFDIGGTFTDVVLVEEGSGAVHYAKVPSTPGDPASGGLDGVRSVLARAGVRPEQISYIVHGTTVSANAVLERKGATTALLTTAGFRDLLEIGRLARGHREQSVEEVLYNIRWVKPPPIVPRRLRYEIPERMGPDGEVLKPLDEQAVLRTIDSLRERRIESVAVCFLHCYANPAHEQRVGELIKQHYPSCHVSLSSDVLPQYREYERLSTTSLNAYVMPPLNRYLGRLEDGLKSDGISAPLHVMQATGGVMTAKLARVKSVHTALSGFVGGVLGGAFLARLAGFRNVVTLDIGGTSTDVSVVRDGEPEITTEGRLGEHPIQIPIVSVQTIGAGGGSIASFDEDRLLKVGPRSAGADPGPACYSRGGTEATVTDANVRLGRLNPHHLLDGALKLNAGSAAQAVEERIANPLGLSPERAALGIVAVMNANIARAIRAITVQRGIDPRECVLVAFGGAGALHAAEIAASLNIPTALVPPYAGVISALGLLTCDIRQEYSRTWIGRMDSVDIPSLEEGFQGLESTAAAEMVGEGVAPDALQLKRSLALRYVGQGYEIITPTASGKITPESLHATTAAFHVRHHELYRHSASGEPVEIVAIGVTAQAGTTPPKFQRKAPKKGARRSLTPQGTRSVWFEGINGPAECPVYRREALSPGDELRGPAIVEQFDTTTVLPPNMSATIDPYGSLLVRVSQEKS